MLANMMFVNLLTLPIGVIVGCSIECANIEVYVIEFLDYMIFIEMNYIILKFNLIVFRFD